MVSASADRDKYIAVASGVAFSAFEFTAIKTATNWAYKKSSSTATTAVNTIYPIGKVSTWDWIKIGSLWAKFSTSESTKVRFSKGNLYCDKNTDPVKYWFEANQYDFRHYKGEKDDAAIIGGVSTTTPSGTVGSFFWSKKASKAYAESLDTITAPDASDVFFTNETTTTPKIYFIAAGQTGIWRTLSGGDSGEWKYLLDSRSGVTVGSTTNARYALVKVNSLAGMLIFPDIFTWPSDVITKPSKFNKNSSDWNNVNYSKTDFAKLETAGCVFLPAAGYRIFLGYNHGQVNINYDGNKGYFFSSTLSDDNHNPYCLEFRSDQVNPKYDNLISVGCSVRLVTAAK